MKNRVTDPFDIRLAWTDASAARFLRAVVLRKPRRRFTCDGGAVVCPDGSVIRGRECESAIATDAAAPTEPTIAGAEWMTTVQPDANELREASAIVEFYAGVPFGVGQQREAAYRLRKLERSLEP
jgi:hypothetical protein